MENGEDGDKTNEVQFQNSDAINIEANGNTKTDRKSDATTEDDESSKKRPRDGEESGSEGIPKKGRFELEHIGPAVVAGRWSLDEELSDFFHEYRTKYVPEKDLLEKIGKYPVPINIGKSLKLDTHMETLLKKEGNATPCSGGEGRRLQEVG